jgi:hypothetical protein
MINMKQGRIDRQREILTAAQAREVVRYIHELLDTDEIRGAINLIICRARSARVDREALQGLAEALKALKGDPAPAMADKFGPRFGHYPTEVEMFAAISDADDQLRSYHGEIAEYLDLMQRMQHRARSDRRAGEAELERAQMMPVDDPCNGCHAARSAAIDAARAKIDDAKEREGYADDAIEELRQCRVAPALVALRRVADDYETVYATVLSLVRADPHAMPADGNFISGRGAMRARRNYGTRATEMLRNALARGDGDQADAAEQVHGPAEPIETSV